MSCTESGQLRMVSDGAGRIFRRKDGKYLIYVPINLAKDSMFPFKGGDSMYVRISFAPGGEKQLIVEKWMGPLTTPPA